MLCSLAQGRSMKQIGRELAISPKTVDHHLQHIYAKVGVTTHAGATLYAMEQGYTATFHRERPGVSLGGCSRTPSMI
jgi:DNA-binding NarL/FixJ family response regulator